MLGPFFISRPKDPESLVNGEALGVENSLLIASVATVPHPSHAHRTWVVSSSALARPSGGYAPPPTAAPTIPLPSLESSVQTVQALCCHSLATARASCSFPSTARPGKLPACLLRALSSPRPDQKSVGESGLAALQQRACWRQLALLP